MDEEPWEEGDAILDTGCKSTVCENEKQKVYIGEVSTIDEEPWGEVDAILDTGCKSTVCGELVSARIVIRLSQNELKRMKDTRKESNKVFNFGTSSYKSKGVMEIPVTLKDRKFYLRTEILEGDMP